MVRGEVSEQSVYAGIIDDKYGYIQITAFENDTADQFKTCLLYTSGRQFHDVYRKIFEGETVRGKKNMEKGVNWILPTPWSVEKEADLDQKQRSRRCV